MVLKCRSHLDLVSSFYVCWCMYVAGAHVHNHTYEAQSRTLNTLEGPYHSSLIPLGQYVSLKLEQKWWPMSPSGPPVCTLHSNGMRGIEGIYRHTRFSFGESAWGLDSCSHAFVHSSNPSSF